MAKYQITAPDGGVYEVEGSGTEAEALAHFKANYKPAPQAQAAPEVEPPKAPPLEGWDRSKDIISRMGTGLMDPIVGAGQIMERTRVPGLLRKALGIEGNMDEYVKQRDAEYKGPQDGGFDWARMGGNIANPLNYLGGAPATMGRAAAMGAIQSTLAPTAAGDDDQNFFLKKAGQAALGGAMGAAAHGLTRGVIKPTDDARALIDQNVRVTPGQAAGGKLATLEQKMTSLPVAGDVIADARHRAVEDVQGNLISRALNRTGRSAPDVGAANEAASAMYQQSVPHLRANPEGISEAMSAAAQAMRNPEMTPQNVKILEGLFKNNFSNYPNLDGQGLKALDSELGFLARKYGGFNASPADRTLADALNQVKMALRGGLEVGMQPEASATLRQANQAYRQLVPINKAASGKAGGVASARALQKATARAARTDVTRMAPDALLDPAVRVLGDTVPDSGTAGRALNIAALANPMTAMKALAAWPVAKAIYSETGTRGLLGMTAAQRAAAPYSQAAVNAIIAALRGAQQ